MLVVFDLDGTVIDSSRALLKAHGVAWARVGLERPPDQAILDLVGLPLPETMHTLAPHHDPEPLATFYSEAYVTTDLRKCGQCCDHRGTGSSTIL
jgi:phosphoglycolate phosphatase